MYIHHSSLTNNFEHYTFHAFPSCVAYLLNAFKCTTSNILILLLCTGGEFDLMSRRVVCASSEKLAKDIASRLTQYEMERD